MDFKENVFIRKYNYLYLSALCFEFVDFSSQSQSATSQSNSYPIFLRMLIGFSSRFSTLKKLEVFPCTFVWSRETSFTKEYRI